MTMGSTSARAEANSAVAAAAMESFMLILMWCSSCQRNHKRYEAACQCLVCAEGWACRGYAWFAVAASV
jgi:hypothetical protein